MTAKVFLAASLALALGACGESDEAVEPTEGGDAQGEVRGGTISDDMLPLATVRSTSPIRGESGDEEGDDDE